MRIYTSHLRGTDEPVLVREGFSFWAALFGWLWLLFQGAWIPAALVFAASVAVARICPAVGSPAPFLGLLFLQGLFGRDLVRWSLKPRGYVPGPVLAAADADAALARLCEARPALLAGRAGAAG